MRSRAKYDHDRYSLRADQAADGFRTLISVLIAGLLALSAKHEAPEELEWNFVWAQVAALAAIALVGFSWSLQKGKSLKRMKGPFNGDCWTRNEKYDVWAFSLFLFGAVQLFAIASFPIFEVKSLIPVSLSCQAIFLGVLVGGTFYVAVMCWMPKMLGEKKSYCCLKSMLEKIRPKKSKPTRW